jgi:hypothetical protein
MNPYVVHRDEAIFGKHPDEFRPERWLEGDEAMMNRFTFQVSSEAVLEESQSQFAARETDQYGKNVGAFEFWECHLVKE